MGYIDELNKIVIDDKYKLKIIFHMFPYDIIENIYKHLYLQYPQSNKDYLHNLMISGKVNNFMDLFHIFDINTAQFYEYRIAFIMRNNINVFKEFIDYIDTELIDKSLKLHDILINRICYKYNIEIKSRIITNFIKYSIFIANSNFYNKFNSINEVNIDIMFLSNANRNVEGNLEEFFTDQYYCKDYSPEIFIKFFTFVRYPKYHTIATKLLILYKYMQNRKIYKSINDEFNNHMLKLTNYVESDKLFDILSHNEFIYLPLSVVFKKTITMLSIDILIIFIFIIAIYTNININNAVIILTSMQVLLSLYIVYSIKEIYIYKDRKQYRFGLKEYLCFKDNRLIGYSFTVIRNNIYKLFKN